MPSNPILICARDPALRDELERSLTSAGYPLATVGSPADAVAAMRNRSYDLIVAEGLAASGAIASLRTAGTNGVIPVLVVAPAHDVEARIAFLEAGADDVIAGGFAPNELEGRVMAQLIRTGKVSPDVTRTASAEVIAFFSPKGGVGTTTLAVNTAVLLAGGAAPAPSTKIPEPQLPTSRVLLVDMDLQFGQVATHLNLTPRYGIDGFATDEPALSDPELARQYLTPHSSGLMVLAAPVRPEADARVTVDHIERILSLLRPSFDHIVVDLGSRLDPRTVWVLEQSDAHVFVLFPEIAALRSMSLLLAFLAETTPVQPRTSLVVNHVFPKELLKTRDVENLLRAKPAAEIPYTEVEMIRSVNEGVPLVIGRPASPATAAMRRVAQSVIGIQQQPGAPKKPERRSLFSRR
ncbi:MAG: AAA family ATPase [Chloroflexi bacterium]|nr:AAA family ATPase [Chloroflexota bacterium]